MNGDWFKVLDRSGVPDLARVKVGPWECPYRHSRMCFEMLDRLERDPGLAFSSEALSFPCPPKPSIP